MRNKLLLNILALLMVFSFVAMAANAQPTAIVFKSFERVFGDFGETYENYGIWVDLIAYIFLFIFTTKFAFRGRQQETGVKSLSTVVGVVLAISATVYEANSGFRLGNIGPWALALGLLIIGYMVYNFVDGMGFGKTKSAALGFIIAYGFMLSVARPVFDLLYEQAENNVAFAWLAAILDFIFLAAIIALIIGLFGYTSKFFGGGGLSIPRFRSGGDRGGSTPTIDATRKEEKETIRDAADTKKEIGDEKEGEAEVEKADELIDKDISKSKGLLNFLKGLRGRPDALSVIKIRKEALEKTIDALLTYSTQAEKAIQNARKKSYDVLRLLKTDLSRKAQVDARAESEKLPEEQADARKRAYNRKLRELEKNNTQHIQSLREQAIQAERGEEWIINALNKIVEMEEQVKIGINELINAKTIGEATEALNKSIPALDMAIKELSQAKQFGGKVAARLATLLGLETQVQKELGGEKVIEQYEIAQGRKA